jgi:hypothetical protein
MKWKIFIITHGPIIEDYYKNDSMFSDKNYTFINVSDTPILNLQFDILNKNDIKNFIHLGKWYAEGEAIYNVYKNNLYTEYDYIGFIHWDYELLSENLFFGSNITSAILMLIAHKEEFISFSTYTFAEDYYQNIMMDLNFPNQLVGSGKNCWEKIIDDYNKYFGTEINIDFLMSKRINLCSAFLCEISVFKELMGFYCSVVENKHLDKYDHTHEYRFQGGMLERYIGCFSHRFNFAELPLYHHWTGSFEKPKKNKFRKIISSIVRK